MMDSLEVINKVTEVSMIIFGETILLNPGELIGKNGNPGFCIVNTDKRYSLTFLYKILFSVLWEKIF